MKFILSVFLGEPVYFSFFFFTMDVCFLVKKINKICAYRYQQLIIYHILDLKDYFFNIQISFSSNKFITFTVSKLLKEYCT